MRVVILVLVFLSFHCSGQDTTYFDHDGHEGIKEIRLWEDELLVHEAGYYENGLMAYEVHFQHKKRNPLRIKSSHFIYYENGMLMYTGRTKEFPKRNSKRIGTWHFYSDRGEISKTVTYMFGLVLRKKCFETLGNIGNW